ncbi:MAG: hypothetical protein MRY74_03475 [Neomegalonema sp.]|nr:hypothetical protein [Neomegalonema sp.]
MTRASLLSAVASVTLSLVAAVAPAGAQTKPSFTPPLSKPAPLTEKVSIRLSPGSYADCTDVQAIEGAPVTAPPPGKYRLAVEAADDKTRVKLIDGKKSAFEISVLLSEAGEVTLEKATMAGGATADEKKLIAAVIAQLPELRLHRRAFGQGDSMFDNDELAKIFGQMFAAMGGSKEKPEVTGGALVAGQSETGGRKVIVFKGTIRLKSTKDKLRITQRVQEAYDIETGLRVYSSIIARMPFGGKTVIFRQTTTCSISSSKG